ncbi:MAG TPA: protein kinase [Polyangiales bacterium]|nr:protein kinase [Polyangiales bacterium]
MTAKEQHRIATTSRYELIRPLGEGGVGTVYVALDRESGEQVALKMLSRINPLSVLRFKREFRALANIHHRNLVQLYELEHADDGWFLSMELVDGEELLRGLTETGPIPDASALQRDEDLEVARSAARLPRIIDAFSQLANGIHAIHQAGMLHRDLKPSNVMLDRQGRVVVLDFGLVRELSPSNDVTLDGVTAGTPAYMPPEQARGEGLSEASDWYAFGVMLYEALSGYLPIDGRTPLDLIQRKLELEPPPLLSADAPAPLRELCASLLRVDPRQRATVHEILDVLARASEPRTPTETQSLLPEPPSTQSSSDLFGRDAERSQLESALEACVREHSTVAVHVRGPSGAGKTALVESFLAGCPSLALPLSAEPLVVRSRCYEREAMPFKSIDGAIDALATHLMALDDFQVAYLLSSDIGPLTVLFPVLERVPAVRRLLSSTKKKPHGDATQLRRRAEEGFRYLLRSLAATRPLVIWIDDLQWGDLDSTQVLLDWLKRPIDGPVLLVLSYRSDEVATNATLSALLSPAARDAQQVEQFELDLKPLRDSDVHALCSKRIGDSTSPAPHVIARIVRDSCGNPFLASQLAALARAKLDRGETDLAALSIKELVLHTSALLPPPAQELLRVLAVAGRPLAPRIVLEAADIGGASRAYIHELQSLRLVRTRYVARTTLLEIYHDGVRESVHAALTEAELQRVQASLLRALLREGQADAAWLHQLALAAGERKQALQYGLRAAQIASENLAFEQAAELYERCVQLADSEQETTKLWTQLALALAHCGRGIKAADAYLKASEHAAESERVTLLCLAASHLLRSGRFEEGEQLVKRVLAALEIRVPTSDAGLYAAIGWERARIAVLERVVRPREGVVIPPEELRIGTLYGNLALDTQCHMPLRATLFQTRATRMCFQYGESRTTARAYCMNAALAALSGGGAAAQRVSEMLARAEALIDCDAQPQHAFELYAARASCAVFLGQLAQALEPALAAEELYATRGLGDDLGDYFYMFVVRAAYVSALQFLGRHNEAAVVVRRLIDEATAKNNRSAVLQTSLACTAVEQAEQGCRGSRARLDLEHQELPASTGVLHMLHLLAVMRAGCTTGEHDWALARHAELAPRLHASPLKHSAFFIYLLQFYHARLVLNAHVTSGAGGDPEPLVREHLQWLAKKSPLPFRKLAPLRIRARVALIRGDRALAKQLLLQSAQALEELGAADDAARERYALGFLTGGEDGEQRMAAAIAALSGMGMREPESDLRAYFPELVRGA